MKLITIIIFSMMLLSVGCGISTTPGKGQKIGQIVSVRKEGIFCKTYEAQLIRGGMSGGNGTIGIIPFDFTIEDEDMAKTLSMYMKSQKEVIITFRQEGFYSFFRTESCGVFIEKVEEKPMDKP